MHTGKRRSGVRVDIDQVDISAIPIEPIIPTVFVVQGEHDFPPNFGPHGAVILAPDAVSTGLRLSRRRGARPE